METSDLTVRILTEIRDEIRSSKDDLRAELRSTKDDLRAELQTTNVRLDQLQRHVVESEFRVGTAILEHTAVLRDIRDRIGGPRDLRARVDRCEREIDELKRRTP
jgi:hypothetical protein